jgi:hypothetical protein
MKKSIFVVAGVAMLALASCKKDYTCECTVTTMGIAVPTLPAEFKDVKKKDAEEACDALQTTYTVGGATASCSLK